MAIVSIVGYGLVSVRNREPNSVLLYFIIDFPRTNTGPHKPASHSGVAGIDSQTSSLSSYDWDKRQGKQGRIHMRKWHLIPGLALLAILFGLGGCINTRLPNVSLSADGPSASPSLLAPWGADVPVTTRADWEARRAPRLRDAFQEHFYGRWPANAPVVIRSKTLLANGAFDGMARIEQWEIALGGAQGGGFSMLVVLPIRASGPVPLIIMQNFCGNTAAYPDIQGVSAPRLGRPKECDSKFMGPIIPLILGDAISEPPTRRILEAGYGMAMFHAGEVVPDDPAKAEAVLAELTPPGTLPDQRTGAIAAWAWLYGRAMDAVKTDARFDPERMILWGHSRNGKAALLAAAMDPRAAAVIALQSGTGGASLGRDDQGETIASITTSFPHWFSPAFAQFSDRHSDIPVDQHHLLALIAPRPVLLAGARRDAWSDPLGAIKAAEGASPAYELYGLPAFRQTDRMEPDLSHPLVTYMRPGLHGIHDSDWTRALDFLDQRVKRRT